MTYDFTHAVVGGTFDHFHSGHQRILDFAYHRAKKITIGITTDRFVQNKAFVNALESFEVRRDQVTHYIEQNGWKERTHVIKLNDIYGPTLIDTSIDAIIVTRETKPNAVEINNERSKINLTPLRIVTVPFYKGNDNKIVRSSRIRKGVINRIGTSYQHYFSKYKQLNLPPRLRNLLRKPLGTIIEGEERFTSLTADKAARWIKQNKPIMLITVGDIVTSSLREAGITPDVAIIDHRTRRKKLSGRKTATDTSILNPAGTIRQNAVYKMKQAIEQAQETQQYTTLVITGEEDLLALPAILLAPLNAIVVYGQADLGIILIRIEEAIKQQVAAIIEQFE